MTLLQPSSSAAATALTAINSMGTTRASVNAQETDIKKKGKQLHLDGIKQDQTAAELANSAPSSIVKKQSTAAMKPDIGILSKDFLKNKGQGEQPVDKQFAVHQKKLAAGDVDVGILSNKRQHGGYWLQQHQTTPGANLHAENGVTGRSLQSGWLPNMCPGKYGYAEVEGGLYYRGPGLIYLYGGPGVIYGGLYYTITNNLLMILFFFPSAAAQVQPHVGRTFVNAWNMPMVTSFSAWIHSISFVNSQNISKGSRDLGQWRSVWVTRLVLYISAPFSPALLKVVQFGSVFVMLLIAFVRKSEINGLAQDLNAVKLKLMMREGRHVSIKTFLKIIMTKTHPSLFPTKK
jgi:hypothetical protein